MSADQALLPIDNPAAIAMYPPEPYRTDLVWIPVKDLPIEAVKPAGWLLHSVAKRGILVPLVVLDYGDDGYKVAEGKRRTEAARRLGIDKVPANVLDGSEVNAAAIALALNNQRDNNAVVEYEAIVDLYDGQGFSVEAIAEATGITQPTIRASLSLLVVADPILAAMRAYKVKYTVVRRIAKLSKQAQDALAAILAEKGTITAKDVRPFWLAEQAIPTTGDVLAADPIHQWVNEAAPILTQILLEAPLGVPGLDKLREFIDMIEGSRNPDRDAITEHKAA